MGKKSDKHKDRAKKKLKKKLLNLMLISERVVLFLGSLFGLIYTLKELFFK